jgi:hypothetical protein
MAALPNTSAVYVFAASALRSAAGMSSMYSDRISNASSAYDSVRQRDKVASSTFG